MCLGLVSSNGLSNTSSNPNVCFTYLTDVANLGVTYLLKKWRCCVSVFIFLHCVSEIAVNFNGNYSRYLTSSFKLLCLRNYFIKFASLFGDDVID